MATRFEFSYETPQPNDADGNPVPPVPTTFALGGISLDVAKGIRRGLGNVGSIQNVTAARVVETSQNVTDTMTASS